MTLITRRVTGKINQRNGENKMVLLKSKVFLGLLCNLIAFVVAAYAPNVPLTADALLMLVGIVLAAFGITPELQARGLL
jgi:hypothetical protein